MLQILFNPYFSTDHTHVILGVVSGAALTLPGLGALGVIYALLAARAALARWLEGQAPAHVLVESRIARAHTALWRAAFRVLHALAFRRAVLTRGQL